MAEAKIMAIGSGDLEIVSSIYNEVFSPHQDEEFFKKRFRGRYNVCILIALMDDRPVGFAVGFELRPSTFYCWLCGVRPDARRLGIAIQLMSAIQSYADDHGYNVLRFECQNQHRPMLHVAISEGYDLVGIRWDTHTSCNMVVFEKDLR